VTTRDEVAAQLPGAGGRGGRRPGRSNAEIGALLYLGVPTIKTHVSSILTRLDLSNRVQIALLAHDAGLLDEPE
jgi:Bacterial regulatory proteins, luxR family